MVLPELGTALRAARDTKQLSLEAAARPAKISGAYLHKLEGGKVSSPSPRVLARLADALGVPYLQLMGLAGYLDPSAIESAEPAPPKPHPLADRKLSPDEWRAVGAFIETLIAMRTDPSPAD